LRQEVVWGLNYRSMADRFPEKGLIALQPPNSRDNIFSGFVQDQVALLDSLKITLGTKLEHNDFSGFEYQPTARIAWSPFHDQTLWGAVSRAVRVPTRLERDIALDASDPTKNPVLRLLGSRAFRSEVLLAYELGYRWQIEKKLFVDLAAYYNVYSGLDSFEFDPSFVDPQTGRTIVPIVQKNLTDGVAKGGEASLTLTPVRSWRLVANYTYLLLTLHPKGQDLSNGQLFAGASPRNQVSVQSFLDLPAHFQLDAVFRYASSLLSYPDTPAYSTLDLRVAWQGLRNFELSLVGRSLLQAHHRESPGATEVERSAYAKLAGRF
jgi:iron complex outermembrane receptor protein